MDDAHGVLIAEDDNLACVFDGSKSTALKFVVKAIPAKQPFNVALLAADNTASCSSLGPEQLLYPGISGERNRRWHSSTMSNRG
ncbi:hypothetical protein [Leisingera sp. F5]|uniref:hypothetical protein n=1 Tax=Leisingera sp. F5 TaxID=1813816 RepID=UPI000AE0723F